MTGPKKMSRSLRKLGFYFLGFVEYSTWSVSFMVSIIQMLEVVLFSSLLGFIS